MSLTCFFHMGFGKFQHWQINRWSKDFCIISIRVSPWLVFNLQMAKIKTLWRHRHETPSWTDREKVLRFESSRFRKLSKQWARRWVSGVLQIYNLSISYLFSILQRWSCLPNSVCCVIWQRLFQLLSLFLDSEEQKQNLKQDFLLKLLKSSHCCVWSLDHNKSLLAV